MLRPKATVIIVHGAFEHSKRYSHVIERLEQDGYRVITGDLPGQGESEGKRGHIKSFDDYLHKVMEWINEAEDEIPLFVLGHSMGGLIVIRFMQKLQPHLDGVILSSPALGLGQRASKPMEIAGRVLNKVCPGLLVSSPVKPEMVTNNPEVIESYQTDELMLKKVSVRWYREFQKAIQLAFKHAGSFPGLPLLVMQAGKDVIVDAQKTYEWFHLIKTEEKMYKEWPLFYHELFNEGEWEQAYLYMLNFMEQQLSSRK
ncbi:alpha/beta hydrolase [Halobacillus sp. Marseille-Q1614]|uniref:alpha/beta hydrolase n=1 Tax=Halobacillus sp. Marseille-Q1614 TaxID=2709134 RepID=UPI00156DEE6D|nr:alpha/beta hydrolase [Halobacillus sp. Marseille-Q1614]